MLLPNPRSLPHPAPGEHQIENDPHHRGEGDTGELEFHFPGNGEGQPAAAYADDQDHRRNGQVPLVLVVDAAFREGSQPGGRDYPEEKHRDAA